MKDATTPADEDRPMSPPVQEQVVCLRCGTSAPVNDDGFCDKCERALEQACL